MRETFSLPPALEKAISQSLEKWGLSLTDSRRLAEAILRMSDFYIANPKSPTPWKESWCQIAQLAYFLPLNFLRSQAVFHEARNRHFDFEAAELLDFGSGLGAGSLPWLSNFAGQVLFTEQSSEAQKLHRELLKGMGFSTENCTWLSEKQISPRRNRTGLFSYSLTEVDELPSWAMECDSLIVVEPSTREDGRNLLKHRKDLLAKGFSMWAPCPHQEGCPLFEDSKTDWCHDRIHIKMPEWFQKIEGQLPMKNQTLTFSYLLASKKPSPVISQWRTVGDQLEEKGKTRQLLCRNSKRQFLAWLHRDGPAPEIARGELIDPPQIYEERSNEIRIRSRGPDAC